MHYNDTRDYFCVTEPLNHFYVPVLLFHVIEECYSHYTKHRVVIVVLNAHNELKQDKTELLECPRHLGSYDDKNVIWLCEMNGHKLTMAPGRHVSDNCVPYVSVMYYNVPTRRDAHAVKNAHLYAQVRSCAFGIFRGKSVALLYCTFAALQFI